MRPSLPIFLCAVLLLSTLAAHAQDSSASDSAPGSVTISSLVATVAHKTHKKFVLDPRVRANVSLFGEEPSSVTYDELLTILDTYGYTAVDSGGYIQVIPVAMVRFEPLPIVTDNDKRPADEYVTTVIHVKSLSAAELVPILRPMVSRQGHFAAMPCSNDLLMVERFANVRRLESVIKAMDKGAPIKLAGCAVPMSGLWQPPGPPMRSPEPNPRAP